MQATTQTRLRLSEETEAILQRYGDLYGTLKRKLYARVAAGVGKAMAYKTDFCRTHAIPACLLSRIQVAAEVLFVVLVLLIFLDACTARTFCTKRIPVFLAASMTTKYWPRNHPADIRADDLSMLLKYIAVGTAKTRISDIAAMSRNRR